MNERQSLNSYLRPFLKRFLLALGFMLLVALFTTFFAVIILPLMDEMLLQAGGRPAQASQWLRQLIIQLLRIDERSLVHILPLLLLLSFLGQAIFSFLSLYLMKTLGLKVIRNIRDKLYRNLIFQSVEFLSKAKTGDLVARIANDIEKIKLAVAETLAVYVRETLTLIGLVIWIFVVDSRMALTSLLIFPVITVPLVYFGRKVKRRGIQSQETISELSHFLSETVSGNKLVKAYNMQEFEINKFRALNLRNYRINAKIALAYSLSAPIMDVIGGVVAAIFFSMGMTRIAAGTLSPGQFTSFIATLFLMYSPIKRLLQAHNDYQQGKAGFERVQQIIASERSISDSSHALAVKKVSGRVEFHDVHFAYQPQTPVLKGVNFAVHPNELIALVGPSGAGKTTLLSLLLRFYEPGQGEILIDGRDLRSFTLKSLREHIGLVTQEVFLFNDTVLNNIAYGNKDYALADIRQAAEIARAHEFIMALPHGYQTFVGERGVFISMGQRQRVSIARAILKKPSILIFDEATSALDSESETLIQEAMAEVMKNRTTFVIAHRLSTIQQADRILVMNEGEIKESGSHAELLARRGLYHTLYSLQFPNMDIVM